MVVVAMVIKRNKEGEGWVTGWLVVVVEEEEVLKEKEGKACTVRVVVGEEG